MKGFTIMYDYRGKVAGYIVSAIGLIAMVAERIHPFVLKAKWNAEQHYSLFVWVTLFGLFLVAYSKEKVDDERTKLIRLKALQIAFMVMTGTIMAFALATSLATEKIDIRGQDLNLIPAIGIVMYLLLFHTGLYFDDVWEYEDKGLFNNLKNIPKNKWGILAYFIVCAIAMLLLTFL